MDLSPKTVDIIVKFFKWLYLLSFVLLIILLLPVGVVIFTNPNLVMENLSVILVIFFIALLSGLVFLGLKKKRPWVVSFFIYSSIYISISQISYFVMNWRETSSLSFRLSTLLTAIIQLLFFSKKEVREYFGIKNIFLGR